MFQRIWSGPVTTERRAWELLSLIDQIHLWGVTDFRDFVITHLTPWHEFGQLCFANDVKYALSVPNTGLHYSGGQYSLQFPKSCVELPKWTQHITGDAQLKRLKYKVSLHLYRACAAYGPGSQVQDHFPAMSRCDIDECGPRGGPGYPLRSLEEHIEHLCDVHGATRVRGQKRRLEEEADGDTDAAKKPKSQM